MKTLISDNVLQKMKQFATPLGIDVNFSADKNRWGQVHSKLTFTIFYRGIRIVLASFDAGDNHQENGYSGLFIPMRIKKKDFFKMTKSNGFYRIFAFLSKTTKSSYSEINKAYMIFGTENHFLNKLLCNSELKAFILNHTKYNYGLRPLKRKHFHEAGLKSRNDMFYITTRNHSWITDQGQIVTLINFGKSIVDHLIQNRLIRSPEIIN